MKRKTYEFSSIGYAQFCKDIELKKQKRANLITGSIVVGGMFAFGIISKEIALIYGANTIINIVTDWLI